MRKVTVCVFFDLIKAFDNVNHQLLIRKLRNLDFSCLVLRWICAYLVNRRQAVRDPISQNKSDKIITSGVPQGSVLGSLLFILYLLDFKETLNFCKYNFYPSATF